MSKYVCKITFFVQNEKSHIVWNIALTEMLEILELLNSQPELKMKWENYMKLIMNSKFNRCGLTDVVRNS